MSRRDGPASRRTEPPSRPAAASRVPRAGWRVVAAKEFGDHLLSVRFIVLLLVLGLAAAIPLYFAADGSAAAPQVPAARRRSSWRCSRSGRRTPDPAASITFVGIVAPLLGLAFAFDAVNGERSEGTLPRLLAQPIHRDDVINGKFAAGLAVIGLVLVAVVAAHRRLRHAPARDRARRPRRSSGSSSGSSSRSSTWGVARVRAPAVGGRPSRRDRGADRVRRLAPADDLRPLAHQLSSRGPAHRSGTTDRRTDRAACSRSS